MRRFLAASTVLVLFVLGSQVALAQYGPNGSLTLDRNQVVAGGTVQVTGTGFAPGTDVRITIESTPVLLATVTADVNGAFVADVKIPNGFSGQHTLIATGTDPQGSVRVLESPITVGTKTATMPPTTTLTGGILVRGSDAQLIGLAAALIVVVSLGSLALVRRASR